MDVRHNCAQREIKHVSDILVRKLLQLTQEEALPLVRSQVIQRLNQSFVENVLQAARFLKNQSPFGFMLQHSLDIQRCIDVGNCSLATSSFIECEDRVYHDPKHPCPKIRTGQKTRILSPRRHHGFLKHIGDLVRPIQRTMRVPVKLVP